MGGKPWTYQGKVPRATKPRIAMHHGIWRELLTAISRNSTEIHDEGGEKWFFPSAVSEASHIEWTVRQILVHLDLFPTPRILYKEIAKFHTLHLCIILPKAEIITFFACRPDGVAFSIKDKGCVFLKFTRSMDSVTSSDEGVAALDLANLFPLSLQLSTTATFVLPVLLRS